MGKLTINNYFHDNVLPAINKLVPAGTFVTTSFPDTVLMNRTTTSGGVTISASATAPELSLKQREGILWLTHDEGYALPCGREWKIPPMSPKKVNFILLLITVVYDLLDSKWRQWGKEVCVRWLFVNDDDTMQMQEVI